MENIGKQIATTDTNTANKMQEMEIILGAEDKREKIDTSIIQDIKCKKISWHKTLRKSETLFTKQNNNNKEITKNLSIIIKGE